MKTANRIFIVIAALVLCPLIQAQQLQEIKLNKPDMKRGSTVMQAFSDRQSASEYSEKMLSQEDLSDLLWAANGINRPHDGKKTAASAMNRQDVMIYTFTKEGVHLYDAEKHILAPVVSGDHRKLLGERGITPVVILLVSDVSKFGDVGTPELRKEWGAVDVGLVSQNIAIFCSANNIGTRPRAGMNRNEINSLLGLSDLQLPILNHSIGYPK